MSARYVLYAALVAVAFQAVMAADPKPADSKDKVDTTAVSAPPSVATSSMDGLNMIPQNLMHALTQGGVVALGVVGVAALAALAVPLFGMRYCQLFNTCETGYAYANNAYQNDMYSQYPQSYPTSNTYQKRSADYMGPMLHMLKSAYDKYGQAKVYKTS